MNVITDRSMPRLARGVSLVELMVAVVVGLVMLGGVIQVYLSSKQTYNAQDQLARMQESGRFAMDLITRDLRRAGYWGGNADLATQTGNPGPATPAHTCTNSNAWGRMIDWRVSGLNNTNAGYVDCVPGYVAGTDILTVRYAASEPVDFAAVPANGGLYLRGTMFLGWVMTGALKNDPGNTPPAAVTGAAAHLQPVMRPLRATAYYVGDSGRVCPTGESIPSLFRVRLDPDTGNPDVDEVVTGVEQLQFRYLLGDDYLDANAIADDDWVNVSAVRAWVLVRGECPEFGLGNDATFTMGDVTVPAAPDNFRRQLYVSTVMLRNNIVR
jgi:type IV pilus assembly protein PilW